jgi:hypothetical protein
MVATGKLQVEDGAHAEHPVQVRLVRFEHDVGRTLRLDDAQVAGEQLALVLEAREPRRGGIAATLAAARAPRVREVDAGPSRRPRLTPRAAC